MQFANISLLIDKVIESQAHNKDFKHPSLYLYVGEGSEDLHFFDSAKIKLVIHQDDLETYLHSHVDKIPQESTICLQKCDIILDYGKNNEVTSCQIQSKSVAVDVGTATEKKLKNVTLKIHVDTSSCPNSQIPILPSTRRYLRRIQKQKQAIKYLSKGSKIQILNFISPPTSSKNIQNNVVSEGPYKDNFSTLDTQSLELLQKLKHFVQKEDLLRILIKQPLRNKNSKKVVRMMVVPTLNSDDGTMNVVKKAYDRAVIQELINDYESRDQRK